MTSTKKFTLTGFGIALAAALVLAVVYWFGDSGGESSRMIGSLVADVEETADVRDHGTAPRQSAEPEEVVKAVSEDLKWLCQDLWNPEEACMDALDARFGTETDFSGMITGPLGWNAGLAGFRARNSIFDALGGPAWAEVFEDPLETRRTVAEALSRAECVVIEGEMRPQLRERCAASEMEKLAVLHKACVKLLEHDEAYRELGMHNVYEERWRLVAADVADEAPDHDTYWGQLDELEDERFRFGWRLQRCRTVPEDALAWLEPFPTPETPGYDQAGYLLGTAARLGSEWAAPGMAASRKDLAALRVADPALASLVEAMDPNNKSPLDDLIVAVELSYADNKTWHQTALGTLKERYTDDEIREAIPQAARRIPFELAVVGNL